jgi:hypothetical protein
VAEAALELGVVLDLVERDVPRALDHDLHAVAPGALGQFADGGELGELGLVGRVGEPAGAEPSPMEKVTSCAHDLADVVPHGVHRVLFVVGEHPLGEQRAAAGDDADEAVLDQREVPLADARRGWSCSRRPAGLVLDGLEDDVCSSRSSIFLPDDHRVDRDGADGDGRVVDDRLGTRRGRRRCSGP